MELVSANQRSAGVPEARAGDPVSGTVSDEPISSSGITFRLWRLYQHSWLVALVFPLFALLETPGSPTHLTLGLGGLGPSR
jgi:two-component system, NarL family, sensor histidine kinase DesK